MKQDHPRLRGNYRILRVPKGSGKGSPPLTRELRFPPLIHAMPYRITPAYAGTTSSALLTTIPTQDHPRLRGNYVVSPHAFRLQWGSPPLTRELLSFTLHRLYILRITPAYAGTTGHGMAVSSWIQDHPRLRGNYRKMELFFSSPWGSPPLTRELPLQKRMAAHSTGITPAYAGTTSLRHSGDF